MPVDDGSQGASFAQFSGREPTAEPRADADREAPVFLAVRIDAALKRDIKAEAARRGMTLQRAVPEALRAWLEM